MVDCSAQIPWNMAACFSQLANGYPQKINDRTAPCVGPKFFELHNLSYFILQQQKMWDILDKVQQAELLLFLQRWQLLQSASTRVTESTCVSSPLTMNLENI